ncbi:MAG: histidinol-phosphate transaminase [bacterium]
MIENFMNPNILNISPYNAEREDLPIKLDIMENPHNLPQKIKNKIKKKIDKISFNRYPSPSALALREKLETYTGVSKEVILVGNGSDELILYILLACGGFKKKVIFPTPTFPMYEIIGKIAGCETIGIPLKPDFELNCEGIIKEGKKNSIIFIAYPNNPTGNCFEIEAILKIIKETESIVVIDEAYFEFSKKTFVDILSQYDRLAIIRTFSKGFGLAGIRCGYIMANPQFIDCLKLVKPPYNLNTLTQEIALICLKERDIINGFIEKIIKEREWLYLNLSKIKGIIAYRSLANFILFKTKNPQSLYSSLLKEGILIKKVDDYLRVSIGKHKENKAFIRAVEANLKIY